MVAEPAGHEQERGDRTRARLQAGVFRLEKRRLLALPEPVLARHTPESFSRCFQNGVKFGGIKIWQLSASFTDYKITKS
jgi:hypothetical protein